MNTDQVEPRVEQETNPVFRELEAFGYTIEDELGRGATRVVYKAVYTDGSGLRQERVVKIPFKSIDETSVMTARNWDAWQINTREIEASNNVVHDNISRTIQTVRLSDGRIVNIEDFYKGVMSLDKKVLGYFSDQEFRFTFKKVIGAVHHLNHEEGILHRDLKPSNVLVPGSLSHTKKVLVTDLEQSKKVADIEDSLQATRGGSPYTRPTLLEGLVQQTNHKATPQTEVYALGATMYFALTKENLHDYSVRDCDGGIEVIIAGKQRSIGLFDGEKRLSDDKIDKQEYQQRLKDKLKKVPRKYRAILQRTLSLESDAYLTVGELKRDFEKVARDFPERFYDTFLGSVKHGAWVLAAIAGISIAIPFMQERSAQIRNDRLEDVMSQRQYQEFTLASEEEDLGHHTRLYVLRNEIQALQDNYSEWLNGRSIETLGFKNRDTIESDLRGRISLLDEEMVRCWYIALCMADKDKLQEEIRTGSNRLPFNEKRERDFFVPTRFHYAYGRRFQGTEITRPVESGMAYLDSLLVSNARFDDLLANYFFDTSEIATARAESHSMTYLPGLVDHSPHCGYMIALRRIGPERVRVINTALALYAFSDDQETMDYSMFERFKGVLEANERRFRSFTSLPGENRQY